MPDREMVRKALECIAEDRQKSCTGCEYSIFGLYPFCVHGIARDTLALLKEQPDIVRCKDCQFAEHTMYDDEYRCYFDEENESGCKRLHKGNHFCSDGKRV